jgi:hypothetical protein
MGENWKIAKMRLNDKCKDARRLSKQAAKH